MGGMKRIAYADDDTSSLRFLLRLRMPSLFVGLVLGIALSFVTSQFKEVLARSVEVAYFIPLIVYMADAIGTQTQSIYARDLRTGKAMFWTYLVKELGVGTVIGLLTGVISGGVVYFWLGSGVLALAVGLAMVVTLSLAPVVAVLVTEVFQLRREDPAVGAGPIATVIQDVISVVIYGLIASRIVDGIN